MTDREATARAMGAMREAATSLKKGGYSEIAYKLLDTADDLFCVLRNKTNPKYGGDPHWQNFADKG